MNRHFELIPEDGAIQELVKSLGFPKPNTAQGIGDTLNKIEKQFRNRFAIGIIDDDDRKPKLFDLYENLLDGKDSLKLLQKPNSHHFLIVIEPAIERWLLNTAQKSELITSFHTLKDLQRVTKNEIEVVKNTAFKQFLHQLNHANVPGFVTMSDWISTLYEKHQ